MGDIGEFWRDVKDYGRDLRRRLGVSCPKCAQRDPYGFVSELLPGQKCQLDGFRAPRRKKRKPNKKPNISEASS